MKILFIIILTIVLLGAGSAIAETLQGPIPGSLIVVPSQGWQVQAATGEVFPGMDGLESLVTISSLEGPTIWIAAIDPGDRRAALTGFAQSTHTKLARSGITGITGRGLSTSEADSNFVGGFVLETTGELAQSWTVCVAKVVGNTFLLGMHTMGLASESDLNLVRSIGMQLQALPRDTPTPSTIRRDQPATRAQPAPSGARSGIPAGLIVLLVAVLIAAMIAGSILLFRGDR